MEELELAPSSCSLSTGPTSRALFRPLLQAPRPPGPNGCLPIPWGGA